jgi:thiol-disulfide isomerase/thioredoxin
VPDYVAAVQRIVDDNESARAALAEVSGTAADDVEPATAPKAAGPGDPAVLGPQTSFAECEADPSRLGNCGPARDVVGIEQWLNTDAPLTIAGLRGSVVLVDFWTFGCINCQRTQPYLNEWDRTYRDQGLRIIGVHSPEFDYERDAGNVRDALVEAGIRYPVALDNDFRTWREWSQRFWPARYLIDRDGVVRLVHYGEGAYEETEAAIRALLAQPDPAGR